MVLFCLMRLIKWAVFLFIFALLVQYWITTKEYLFSEDAVAKVAKKYTGTKFEGESTFSKIHADFEKLYPGHVLRKDDLQWIFVNAGGWMGSMCLIHASLTEYVLFFGTPLDTAGHSGRYWANVSDTVLTGTFKQWKEGELTANVYKPGDTILHAWGEVTAVNFQANTWMVEYGRGFIPSTLAFALADTVFSTTDVITMFYTFRIYGKALLHEYSNCFFEMKDWMVDHI